MILDKLSKTFGENSDALRDFVAFVQFKKREKHPWRFFKLYKCYQTAQRITYTDLYLPDIIAPLLLSSFFYLPCEKVN